MTVGNVIQIKSGTKINVDMHTEIQKRHHMCGKDDIWNPSTCTCKNGKYLKSITDNSVITCN